MRNLSEHGALIESRHPMIIGSKVLLRRNRLAVYGQVAWVRGGTAGLEFATPLNAEVVLENITRPKPTAAVVHRRPGVTQRGMSAEERQMFDEMVKTSVRRA